MQNKNDLSTGRNVFNTIFYWHFIFKKNWINERKKGKEEKQEDRGGGKEK